ncbi:unnamed protein product [Symbiodinium natans]|uniref:DUF1275 domain-containing protein n=1 Tax=Symbiodinium natans TaxID=878477 RepID=A0A812IM01_9DINO|nr:unnamed protein product [Symbiodinium natans]
MPSSEGWRWVKHTGLATLLAFVSGYTDVVSIVRYRAFAAMQTGNTIWLGRVIGDDLPDDWNAPFYYAAIPMCFVAGAVLHQLLEKTHFPNRGASIAAVPLASLMMVGEAVYFFTDYDWGNVLRWTVVAIAPLFGVLASACSSGRLGTHTTMVTGHVLSLSNHVTTLLLKRSLPAQDRGKAVLSLCVILGTVLGALLGSYFVHRYNVRYLLFPVPPLLYCLLWLHDHLAKPRAIIKKVRRHIKGRYQEPHSPLGAYLCFC